LALLPSPTTQPFTNSCATMRAHARGPFSLLSGDDSFVMSAADEQSLTPREQVEYTELRATIRERGTARICIFAAGLAAWGALTVATAALASTPLATLLPLLVLAAVFEAIFALHIGVERIGRYLQVFYEASGGAAGPAAVTRSWEHAAMSFGRPRGAVGVDALFTIIFVLAAVFNVAPALILEPTRAEQVFVGGAHALFIIRLIAARAGARSQRGVDLARFRELRDAAVARSESFGASASSKS
jgi:hypothetical protein